MATEVIVIESETFQKMQNMFSELVRMNRKLAEENKNLQLKRLLRVEDICTMTGYSKNTVLRRKEEIGFFCEGKDIKFKSADVDNWIQSYYIKPRKS
jgi:hypothetical protein